MFAAWSRATIKLRWVGFAALLATIVAGLLMVRGTIEALEPGGFEVSGGRIRMIEAELAEPISADGKLRAAFTLLEVERDTPHGLDIAILDGPLDVVP